MHYLFYGENSYLIKEKVAQFKERFFATDPSGLNLAELNGADLKWDDFYSAVFSIPFLSSRRLIIIRNLLLENGDAEIKKNVAEILPKLPESSALVFVEFGMPDRRGILFKALNKPKLSKMFEPADNRRFLQFTKELVEPEGLTIPKEIVDELSIAVQNDFFQGQLEIAKLVNYIKSQKKNVINKEAFLLLVKSISPSNIFEFIEAVAKKDYALSMSLFQRLKQNDQNEIYILSMIIYQFRNMFIVKEYGHAKEEVIAREAKLHPFVVKKTLALLKNYSRPALIEAYHKLRETDLSIKQGRVAPEDALPLLICSLAI